MANPPYFSSHSGSEVDAILTAAASFVSNSYTTQNTVVVNAHVRGLFSASGNIAYDAGTGAISFTGTIGGVNGGTGQTAVAVGDVLYGSATNTWSRLAAVATGNVLISGGVATAPSWGKVGLASHVSGTLAAGNGGTGVTTFGGTNRLLYTTAADTLSSIATANTSALITNSTGAPAWTSGGTANRILRTDGTAITFAQVALATDVTGTLGPTLGGTGQTTVTTGDVLYGSASNTWSKLAGVATGNALISGGVTTAPSWGKIGLTTHVSGTLAVGNGGTGATTFTATRILLGNGASAITTDSGLTYASSILTAPALRITDRLTIDGGTGRITWDAQGGNIDGGIFYGGDGQERIDFSNRFLMYNTTYASIDWGIGYLALPQTGGSLSIDWFERQLWQDDELPCFQWDGASNAPGGVRSMAAFKDITFQTSAIGIILEDRTTAGNFYRLWIDNGVLSLEAVLA